MKSYFQEAVISVKDGALYGEVDANGNYKLIPQETDTFKSTSSYGSVYEFKRDAQTKKVITLTLKVMGKKYPAIKCSRNVLILQLPLVTDTIRPGALYFCNYRSSERVPL